jgi:hypothetical protein
MRDSRRHVQFGIGADSQLLLKNLLPALLNGTYGRNMPTQSGAVLTGAQRALYDALAKLDPRLADMYYGALSVFKQTENPDHLAQTAHSLRELMEKLPRYINVPLDRKGASLTDKVRSFYKEWAKFSDEVKKNGKPFDSGGEISPGLRSFLEVSETFFEWVENERPARKRRTAQMVRGLDPAMRPLPAAIENLRIEEWDDCHDYFENVSHHNRAAEELEAWISILERYLLDKLCPRTFEDHAALDEIIRKGEQG